MSDDDDEINEALRLSPEDLQRMANEGEPAQVRRRGILLSEFTGNIVIRDCTFV